MDIHPFLKPITSNNGLYRPFRVFRNVGSTFTSASIREGQNAEITDSLGLGYKYTITSIRIKPIVKPTISTTITIQANGKTIFTKTILLANIGVLSSIVELLGMDTAMPVELALPVTLTCSASSGTFDIIIDGLDY